MGDTSDDTSDISSADSSVTQQSLSGYLPGPKTKAKRDARALSDNLKVCFYDKWAIESRFSEDYGAVKNDAIACSTF